MQCDTIRAKNIYNNYTVRFILLTFALLLLSSCATRTQLSGQNSILSKDRVGWSKIKGYEKLTPQERVALHSEYQVRYPLTQSAKKAIFKQYSWFIKSQRRTLEIWFKRGENYLPHARRVFVEKGLPEDLAYLAFIESGYNPYAYSRARAAGCWQFMSYTGRRFKLRYASWIDERRDPVRSAEAAASYLKLLYGIFNDWTLAIASYNAGEGKIGRAVRLTGAKDFFELAARNNRLRGRARLARETLNYVPRFLAMVKIAKKHELLGFEPMDFNKAQDLLQVKARGPVSLKHLAASVGLTWKEFALYNPCFRTKYIPSGQTAYIYVPQANAEALNTYLSQKRVVAETVTKRTNLTHKVRRGDTLSRLARRYGTSIRTIKKANRLRSDVIRIGQKLRIPKEEKVVVAKVLKPLKSKDAQPKTASASTAAMVADTAGQQAVELKPGQRAKTVAPVKNVASAGLAEKSTAAKAVKPAAAASQGQQSKVTVTAASSVKSTPKAKTGRALAQGLLELSQNTHKSARKAAPVGGVAQASGRMPAARTHLQAPERRPLEEWQKLLNRVELAWGAPKPAKPAASKPQPRHYEVPAKRPDKIAASRNKVRKPEPVPAPSTGIASAPTTAVRTSLTGTAPRAISRSADTSRSKASRNGHSIRRKISRTTYGTRSVAARNLQTQQTSTPEKNVLDTLNRYGRQAV